MELKVGSYICVLESMIALAQFRCLNKDMNSKGRGVELDSLIFSSSDSRRSLIMNTRVRMMLKAKHISMSKWHDLVADCVSSSYLYIQTLTEQMSLQSPECGHALRSSEKKIFVSSRGR
jgi:hypothetical protein